MFDGDVPAVVKKLEEIDAHKLISVPSIELWFKLHHSDQKTHITSNQLKKDLKNSLSYKEGLINPPLKKLLDNKQTKAVNRAKKLTYPDNPSTNVYTFIERLEDLRNRPRR